MTEEYYYILSLEAKDIFAQEQENGKEKGYILPDKKGFKYWNLFKNVLDNSLDLIELQKCYKETYRNKHFSFDDEYGNKHTLEVINLKFSRKYKKEYEDDNDEEKKIKELRKYFYENGFNLNGKHYKRYKRSSGSSRQGKCLFIDEQLLESMEKWGECGLDKPKDASASWEAYKSLSLSSLKGTINIPLNGILFIPDYTSKFYEEVVSVEYKDDDLTASKKKTEIKNDIWDGESLLDESIFSGNYANYHMLLLRNKFFKSCGFRTKLQKWFKDKKVTLDDLKARDFVTLATDISQIVMVTTPNSMKFLKFMGNKLAESKNKLIKKNIRKWIDKVDSTFGVVKYDKPTKFFGGKMVQTSYQFINTLHLSEEQVEDLLKPSKEYLTKIRNDYDFMNYHISEAIEREEDFPDISNETAERSDVIFKLMKINYDFGKTKLYYNFRNDVVKDQKKKLKKGHILLPGTNATLFGNGAEMLFALSGEFDLKNENNKSMVLKKDEIACAKFGNGEKLVCARSPHITMGNLYCVTNSVDKIWEEYFDLGENIVCVNAIDENIQQRLNGCDYDSDAMLITNDRLVVESAFREKDMFKVPVCDIRKTVDKDDKKDKTPPPELWELDYKTSENKIGEIVNLSQKLNSVLWDKLSNGADYESVQEIYEDVCKLAVLSGIEIDKAKGKYQHVLVGKILSALSKKYEEYKRPKFFELLDDEEIDRQIRYKKDKAEREEKKKELKAKKKYVDGYYKTSMEYACKSADKIDYRKGKPKNIEYSIILDMIKEPKTKDTSSVYRHKNNALAICEKYKDEINSLYEEIRNAEDDEKDALYKKIEKIKEKRKKEVNEEFTKEYVIYLFLKELEKRKKSNNDETEDQSKKSAGENWHLYAPLLDNDLFKNMLKNSKEQMRTVVPKDDGEYDLYGLKFTKK